MSAPPAAGAATDAAAVEIVLTPAGHLRVESAQAQAPGRFPLPETTARRIAAAFEEGSAVGLLHLAASQAPSALPAAFSYWREFAGRFLTTLCLVPETAGTEIGPVPAPEGSELERLCQSAPPMRGSEYLIVSQSHSCPVKVGGIAAGLDV